MTYFCKPINCDDSQTTIKIVYITPDGKNPKRNGIVNIGFYEAANIINDRGEFGSMFSSYLKKWIKAAGILDPRQT